MISYVYGLQNPPPPVVWLLSDDSGCFPVHTVVVILEVDGNPVLPVTSSLQLCVQSIVSVSFFLSLQYTCYHNPYMVLHIYDMTLLFLSSGLTVFTLVRVRCWRRVPWDLNTAFTPRVRQVRSICSDMFLRYGRMRSLVFSGSHSLLVSSVSGLLLCFFSARCTILRG